MKWFEDFNKKHIEMLYLTGVLNVQTLSLLWCNLRTVLQKKTSTALEYKCFDHEDSPWSITYISDKMLNLIRTLCLANSATVTLLLVAAYMS